MNTNASDKPWVLLLSRAVPDPLGGADRLRAWQLLRLLSRTHRVALACMEDGPVSLPQWRDLGRFAQWVHIEPGRELRRRMRASIDAVTTPLLGTTPTLPHPLAGVDALPATTMHAVLATNPNLLGSYTRLRQLAEVDGPCVIDLGHAGINHRLNADAVITPTAGTPTGAWRGPIAVVPPALDRATLRGQTGRGNVPTRPACLSPEAAPPTLVLHGDWSRADTRRDHQRFMGRVWPRVTDLVPHARVCTTAPTADTDRYQQLAEADVMCCLPVDAEDESWPALQGLSLHIPTLVPHRAHALPRPGTQAAGNDAQRIHACIELLTQPELRHTLSTAAAFHDEGEPDIAEQTSRLEAILQPDRLTPQTLPLVPTRHARAA